MKFCCVILDIKIFVPPQTMETFNWSPFRTVLYKMIDSSFHFSVNCAVKQTQHGIASNKIRNSSSVLIAVVIHTYRKGVGICDTGAALNIAHARNITKRATLANNNESCVTLRPQKCVKRAATMCFKRAMLEVRCYPIGFYLSMCYLSI